MKRSFYILAFAASALFIGSCQKEGKGSAETASDADTIPRGASIGHRHHR